MSEKPFNAVEHTEQKPDQRKKLGKIFKNLHELHPEAGQNEIIARDKKVVHASPKQIAEYTTILSTIFNYLKQNDELPPKWSDLGSDLDEKLQPIFFLSGDKTWHRKEVAGLSPHEYMQEVLGEETVAEKTKVDFGALWRSRMPTSPAKPDSQSKPKNTNPFKPSS